jgi:ribosomal protein S18 acetylase RimI-like enzyme
MKIRTVQADDSSVLRQLVVELQAAEAESNSYTRDGELMADQYVAQLYVGDPDVPGEVLVAELDDGEVVGYVAVQPNVPQEEPHERFYHYAYISDIAVLVSHRGKGIGRALLSSAENYAHAAGATVIRMGVLAGNGSARRLYSACGFAERELLLEKSLEDK